MMHERNLRLWGRLGNVPALTTLFIQAVVCLVASVAYAGSNLPVKEQSRQALMGPRFNPVVGELDALADAAEDIFDLAAAGKMDRIAKRLETLKKNVTSIGYLQGPSNSMLLPRLGQAIFDLEQANINRDRIDTMRYANRITLIVATVAIPLKPCIPTEVSLLDYNGRELEIWSEAKKPEKLSNIVMRMHLAWQTLMPKLSEHNGIKELKRFSEIMGRLELARTPEEYGRLSRQASVEIDAMKGVFAKSTK